MPLDSIDPIQVGEGYYLQADGPVAAKPYVLLRKALQRSSRVAVTKWSWHGRERLGILRIRGDAIVLHVMRWPDEIRSPETLTPPPIDLDDQEIDEAVALIDAMTTDDLEGEEYRDRYTEALEEVIRAKTEGVVPPPAPEAEASAAQVFDLMEALHESVAKAKASRGEGEAAVHAMPKKKTAKKTTANRTAAKKLAAKRTTKKATPREPSA